MHININQCYLQYGKKHYMVSGVKVSAWQTKALHMSSQNMKTQIRQSQQNEL